MSEEAKQAPKKKGKLPLILILALVLGGGGFFGMKMRGGPEKPKGPELAPKIVVLPEIVADMSDGAYVKTEVGVQLDKAFDPKKFEEAMPLVRQAANDTLRFKTRRDVRTLDGMRRLRREVAAAMNKVLSADEVEHGKDDKGKEGKEGKKREKEEPAEIPEGWDSAEGPVLRIVFQSFATQ